VDHKEKEGVQMNNEAIVLDSYHNGRTAGMVTVFVGLLALVGAGVYACTKD